MADSTLSVEATALLSAALRHVRDARHLGTAGPGRSIDQAYHLAGYGPECARKATLSSRWFDRVLNHTMGRADRILEIVIDLDPRAVQYNPVGWDTRFLALACWTEQSRYEATGTRSEVEVEALVNEAQQVVDEIALALWADGRLEGGLP